MARQLRRRAGYLALALATIAAGGLLYRFRSLFAPAFSDVAGDALWAMMIAWWIGVVAPGAPLLRRSLVALAICFVVETSQLFHAPWLDTLRSTTLGHLILGSDFDPRDLAAYALGVVAAACGERIIVWARMAPIPSESNRVT